jgi:hypothetical protein
MTDPSEFHELSLEGLLLVTPKLLAVILLIKIIV